jgi:hypothetical protein
VVHLPAALSDHKRGNFGSGRLYADVAKHAELTITTSPCSLITAEMLLVSIQHPFSYNSRIKCFQTHVDITFFFLVCGTHDQSLSAPFCYTLY